jgi:Fe-Mn family superoxide dismutase
MTIPNHEDHTMKQSENNPIALATVSRRLFLQQAGVTACVAAAGMSALRQTAFAQAAPVGFTLPPLPYAYDALEPSIDEQTMKIHHDKHHQTYITNLNTALQTHPELQGKSIESLLKGLDTLPEDVKVAVRNQGGGHFNHTMFWNIMGPGKGGEPTGELAQAITAAFGSFSNFKEAFTKAAIGRFGSGWAWLSVDGNKKLVLENLPNQDCPLSIGKTPILGLDVWEHAYYLKYKNVRPDYVKAWWTVVNWDAVSKNYQAAMKS